MVGPVTSFKSNTNLRSNVAPAQKTRLGRRATCCEKPSNYWAQQTKAWQRKEAQNRHYEELMLKFQQLRDVMIRNLQLLRQKIKLAQLDGENATALKCQYQKDFKNLEADIKVGENYVMPGDVFSPADEAIALSLGLM